MSMCLNRRVLIGLGIAGVALVAIGALTGRGLAWFLPLLFVLACPLSMVAMMAGMRGMGRSHDEPSGAPSTTDSNGEVAQLRAEVAELRQQRDATAQSTADTLHR